MPKNTLSDSVVSDIEQDITRQRLPENFSATVADVYAPLAEKLAKRHQRDGLLLVGLQGAQGSGKSTCATFLKLILERKYGLSVLALSLDDFYLTRATRAGLAKSVHPLFMTRGVPGTHDTALLKQVLSEVRKQQPVHIPIFDKANDNRLPKIQWLTAEPTIDLVLLEGWCVGVPAQSEVQLARPVNALERLEDPQQTWRNYVNQQLLSNYAKLFIELDVQITIQAPSFECVYLWRLLQEQKLIADLSEQGKDTSSAQTPEQIKRFVAHFQRLTEHALKVMPKRSDYLLELKEDHSFKEVPV